MTTCVRYPISSKINFTFSHYSRQLLSALSSAYVILMAFIANNMDPDQTAPLGRAHSVSFHDKISLKRI